MGSIACAYTQHANVASAIVCLSGSALNVKGSNFTSLLC